MDPGAQGQGIGVGRRAMKMGKPRGYNHRKKAVVAPPPRSTVLRDNGRGQGYLSLDTKYLLNPRPAILPLLRSTCPLWGLLEERRPIRD